MQWAFLVLALFAALTELHTGTFYLAGVAIAALLTALLAFWVQGVGLVLGFMLLCALLIFVIRLYRPHWPSGKNRTEFDLGQPVTIRGVSPRGNYLTVSYRGTLWQAVMDDGSLVASGDTAIIVSKTDKLLHLALPPKIPAA
jgi:membrane protein implicated in regulation of membrane protease activity